MRGIECLTDRFAEIAGVSVADCFEIANLLCEEFRKGTSSVSDLHEK